MLKTLRKSFTRRNATQLTQARRPASMEAAVRSTVESLESRRLLSVAGASQQIQQINLDTQTQNYPSINGAGETIVVIDNGGVDTRQQPLAGKVVYSWNYDSGSSDVTPYDNNSHATAVAGEAAGAAHWYNGALYEGVASGANVVALRATGSWNIQQAFDWVVANKSKYNIVGVNFTDQTGADFSSTYGDMATLKNAGVFIGAPGGNSGATAYPAYNQLFYQAGSVDSRDTLSWFSVKGSAVDFVAPGNNITVDWYWNGSGGDYGPTYGTSWASPQVVGLAALVHQVNPNFSVQQEYQIMRDSAHITPDGYYRIDVNAAVSLAYQRSGGFQGGTPTATPTPTPTPTPTSTPAATPTPFTGTAASVGAVTKFSDYDNGGQGTAYNDTTSYNEGDQSGYRSGGVDIGWSGSQNSQYVGWTHAGEWMNYTVNAASSGTYNMAIKAASPASGGTFHVEVDGKNVSGSVSVPNTGAWDSYQTVTVSNVTLSAGNHSVRVVMDGNAASGYVANFSTFQFSSSGTGGSTGGVGGSSGSSSTAFNGTPFSATSLIRAANYDNGGQGTAYNDTTSYNEGDQASYRSGGVDLGWSNSEGSQYVGWTHAGEWMNYTVSAASSGTYTLAVRAAAPSGGGAFHVEVDGVNVSGSVAVPNTGAWDSYQTVNIPNVSLSAGNHIVRLVMDANGSSGFTGNFSSLQFTSGGGSTSTGGGTYTPVTSTIPDSPFAFSTSNATKSSLTLNFYDTAKNESSYVVKRSTSQYGTYTTVATVNLDQATSQGTGWRSYTDSNLAAGTTYYYQVYAVNQFGPSNNTAGSGTTSWS